MLHARCMLTVSVLALSLSSTALAQPRRAPSAAPAIQGGPSVTDLLNARRQLGLSPRQVTRLDSIERAQFSQRGALRAQMESRRDSLCASRRPCVLSPEERRGLLDQAPGNGVVRSMQRGDSTGRALAMSLLDSTQRGRVEGWRMQARQQRMNGGGGRQGVRQREFLRRGAQAQFGRGMGPEFGPRGGFGAGRGPGFSAGGPGFGPLRRFDPWMDGPGRRDMGPRGNFGRRDQGQGGNFGRRGFRPGEGPMVPDSAATGTMRRRPRPGGDEPQELPPATMDTARIR